MVILKVILYNIRSHKKLIFEPATEGLTVISGHNGAGKSTIINAFAWSLFGAKAQGLKVKNYVKEGVNPKTEYVGVESFIAVGDREYKIERRILTPAGGTICNIYSRPLNTDNEYTLDCGPGVVHSESFLRNLLGFDEKGFYSSAFIQQKQVDLIVSAGPRERGSIIEKMIGVRSITEALTMAREELRGLQKALSIIQTGSIEEQEQKVERQKELVIELTGKLKSVKVDSEKIIEALTELEEKYLTERDKQDRFNTLSQELALLNNDSKNKNERLEGQMKLLKSYDSNVSFSEDFYKQVEAEYNTSNKEYLELSTKLGIIDKQLSDYENILNTPVNKEAPKLYKEKSERQVFLRKELDKLTADCMRVEADIKKAEEFTKEINEGVAVCPYCRSKITNLEEEKARHELALKELKESLIEMQNRKSAYLDENNAVLDTLISLQTELDKLSHQKIASEQIKVVKKEHDTIKNELEIKGKLVEVQRKQLEELTSIKSQVKAIETTKANIKNLNNSLIETSKSIVDKQAEIDGLRALNKKSFRELEKKYDVTAKSKAESDLLIANIERDLGIAKATGKGYLEELKAQKKAAEDYAKISKQLNIMHQSIKSLTDFKELRIKTSIPSLSGIATDILTKFTDGAFNKFILNEAFETSVGTYDGKIRDISTLSGGEESAAAIALRLSIALFLSEGTKSLLILDEILASMDENRQQLILETIKDLPNAQVILVAHSQVANSYADKLITL